jgi:glycerol-3-phosphate dehydrogenase (NAD(P)+)
MNRIGVLGLGSWGLALARLLAEKGHAVRLWDRKSTLAEDVSRLSSELEASGTPGAGKVSAATSAAEAVGGAEVVLFVVPSHALREVAREAGPSLASSSMLVSATKGLELPSLMRMSEVLSDELGATAPVVVLAGPSFAAEVARGVPTSVAAASSDETLARAAQDLFMAETFRVYTNGDVAGVELGGALKNVIAIASGICDGLGFGDNTRGALVTRGLAEITRLGVALGARRDTFYGLAGVGDLIATSASRLSRNRHVGEEIGKGKTVEKILGEMTQVAEGVRTTRAALHLARRQGVEMPITEQVYAVLFEEKDPRVAIRELMLRRPRGEVW